MFPAWAARGFWKRQGSFSWGLHGDFSLGSVGVMGQTVLSWAGGQDLPWRTHLQEGEVAFWSPGSPGPTG